MGIAGKAVVAAATLLIAAGAAAQARVKSEARGAPLARELPHPAGTTARLTEYLAEYSVVGPFRLKLRRGGGVETVDVGTAFDGTVPPGIEPLPVDLFTTKDFYSDREL